MAKIHELKLEIEEVEAGKNKMKSMIRVYQKGEWRKDEMQSHFEDWKTIATRIKRGTPMLDKAVGVRNQSIEHAEKLESLYTYLMSMLGMYDLLFKHMFAYEPELYHRARNTVLEELK